MHRTDTVVIGAGQAGLAVSSLLTAASRDHVVLDRGAVAERWRTERWDSLRLLTPNWATRLPGWRYRGPDPDGFMHKAEVVEFFDRYARSFGAPVCSGADVEHVREHQGGFRVVTSRGTWAARDVVVATGANDRPHVPAFARDLHPDIMQLTPARYRAPSSVPPGGVLVVGASASGVQLADELARAGRDVVLAVGSHTRGARRYRGRDIWWWLEATGRNDTPLDRVRDPERAPHEPSIQLVGRRPADDVDLGTLQERGVVITGRVTGAYGTRVRFADNLAATVADADMRFLRLLRDFDAWAEAGGDTTVPPPPSFRSTPVPVHPLRRLDLRAAGISTIVWATGYRRDYSWLDVPVVDPRGEMRQRAGVTPAPGLYVIGLRFQTRRNSNFIDGVRHDARAVASHLLARTRDSVRVAV